VNNLLTDAFGSGLTELSHVLQAAAVLCAFPVYLFLLFTIGTYLFFLGRRLRIEPGQHVDLLLGEFPALKSRYGEMVLDARGLAPKAAASADEAPQEAPTDTGDAEDHASDRDIEEAAGERGAGSELPDPEDPAERRFSRSFATETQSRESMWQIAVHDAPLLILSAVILTGIYFTLTLLTPSLGGDPLTNLLRRIPVGPGSFLLDHLLSGPSGFFVALVGYTLLGGLLLAWLPRWLRRWLSLEWLYAEPGSRRSRLARHLWRNLCFVNYHRLDGTVGKWLVMVLPIYILFLLTADLLAFYYSFELPPAFLAAAHLFPAILPRMFATVWSSPLDFTRPPSRKGRHLEVEELPAHLSQRQYLGNAAGDEVVQHQETVIQPAGNPVSWQDSDLPQRMAFALDLLGRRDLEPFLEHTLANLLEQRQSLVLSGPKGSGRRTLAKLSAFEAAFRGVSTLALVQTRQEARELVTELRAFGHYFPSVECFNIAYAGDDLLYEIRGMADEIDVLVSDMGSFDRAADHRDYLSIFWQRMDLAVLVGVDEASPLVKVEVPFLVKRMTALARSGARTLPILVTALDGGREDQRSFNRLLCRQFTELPLGFVGDTRLDLLTLEHRGRTSLTFEDDLDLLTRFGTGLADAGYNKYFLNIGTRSRTGLERLDQAGWTVCAEDFADESAVVSLVRLQPETFFNQISEIRELSRACPTGHHICFLMPPRDGFEQWLHDQLDEFLRYRHDQIAPVLIPGQDNPLLQRKHLLRLILESPQTPARISELFGQQALADLQAELDEAPTNGLPLVQKQHPVHGGMLHYDRNADYPLPSTRTGEGAIADPDSASPPVLVRCGELGLQRTIDSVRQPSVLWPGRIFALNGERVRVQGAPVDGMLECRPEPEDLRTLKIRQIFVQENRDIRMASDHVFADEGIGIYRARLKIVEVILGYRIWKGRDLVEESTYGVGGQLKNELECEAAVLFFPGLDPEAVHLIAHVLKRYLKLAIADTDDVLDVTHNCFEPFSKGIADNLYHDVTILDTVPGGIGVCDLVTPLLLRKVAALIVSMHEAGAEWYRIQECTYPRLGKFDHVPPDADPDSDLTVADRVVEYFRRVILADEKDEDQEPLDFTCNIWFPETSAEPPETAPAGADIPPCTGAAAAPPLKDLLAKVYADANRIGRWTQHQTEDDERSWPS